MKYLLVSLLLIVWMVLTMVLTITVIGIAIMYDEDSWMSIPKQLLKTFET